MRRLLPLLLAGALGACQCGPENPVPVTLRVKNSSTASVFVDATDGKLGLEVQRQSLSGWHTFAEGLTCGCQSCAAVCDGCECDGGAGPLVLKIPPGSVQERQWGGVLYLPAKASCGSLLGGVNCLRVENGPVDETFRARWCYASSAPGFEEPDAGVPAPGLLPEASLICVEREFQIQDGVMEVSPLRGDDCSSHEACSPDGGVESLCFAQTCTTSCPENDFPASAGWQVYVGAPDNLGFFTVDQVGTRRTYTGSGTVGSARYDQGTMTLQLCSVPCPPAGATGALYITLPPGFAVPFGVGDVVQVKLIDISTRDNPENRAVVIRDAAGGLLLAADSAQLGAILSGADLAPFAVASTGQIAGCEHNNCGKRLFYSTRFTGVGAPLELDPGQSATVALDGGTWQLLNVGNSGYPVTSCSLQSLMPYAILGLREP